MEDELAALADRALIDGDDEALVQLMLAMEGLLKAAATRLLIAAQSSDQDDIFQSVLRRCLSKQDRLSAVYAKDGVKGIQNYLVQAVKNRVNESKRRKTVQNKQPLAPEAESQLADSAAEVIEEQIRRERDVRLWVQVLARGNDLDSELLRLRFKEDLSFNEIGERLNISSGNARSRMHRFLEKLRRDLQRDEGFDEVEE